MITAILNVVGTVLLSFFGFMSVCLNDLGGDTRGDYIFAYGMTALGVAIYGYSLYRMLQ